MTQIAITFKFVVLTVLAIALAMTISIVVTHLRENHPIPIDRHASTGSREIAELPNLDLRLSRVHLLLSNMK